MQDKEVLDRNCFVNGVMGKESAELKTAETFAVPEAVLWERSGQKTASRVVVQGRNLRD